MYYKVPLNTKLVDIQLLLLEETYSFHLFPWSILLFSGGVAILTRVLMRSGRHIYETKLPNRFSSKGIPSELFSYPYGHTLKCSQTWLLLDWCWDLPLTTSLGLSVKTKMIFELEIEQVILCIKSSLGDNIPFHFQRRPCLDRCSIWGYSTVLNCRRRKFIYSFWLWEFWYMVL